MADRISNYRQIRLVINPARFEGTGAGWSLNAVVVKGGIPRTIGIASGDVAGLGWNSSEEEIWAALSWIVGRNYRSPSE